VALILEILSGPRKGTRVPLRVGLKLGRKVGDVTFPDPKISGKHAHIEQDSKGEWNLVDDGSANGIRIAGRRVPRLVLRHGMQFNLGDTLCGIVDEGATSEKPVALNPSYDPSATFSGVVVQRPVDWRNFILDWINKNKAQIEDKIQPVTAFKPGLILKFVQGPQLTTEWEMGYGPRQVGAKSIEFPILEENAPDICFEIIPTPKGVSFKTTHPDVVLVNNMTLSHQNLQAGDVIAIHNTKIEIGFHK
jgi:hypothetical protein